ncbi:hypothetical protein ULMS_01860 [Patiriisocius marinistellae]|uniref:Uncharacterized protein n=1 Tax=Patiriisocius marinistellae TaxID=2494560 RepID=A0A5J4FUA0_9FLAO|nr:hypothetical protein ULMS_01860 [Patiriisocius marinistellae]
MGLVPIKWEVSLNVSGEKTDIKLIVKCCPKKNTKNKPESAMATFLAIEEDIIPIMVVFSKCLVLQKYVSKCC